MLALMDAMCGGDEQLDDSRLPVRSYGCVEMADALATGRCGLPRDPARAKRFYERACARSYPPACNALRR